MPFHLKFIGGPIDLQRGLEGCEVVISPGMVNREGTPGAAVTSKKRVNQCPDTPQVETLTLRFPLPKTSRVYRPATRFGISRTVVSSLSQTSEWYNAPGMSWYDMLWTGSKPVRRPWGSVRMYATKWLLEMNSGFGAVRSWGVPLSAGGAGVGFTFTFRFQRKACVGGCICVSRLETSAYPTISPLASIPVAYDLWKPGGRNAFKSTTLAALPRYISA